MKRGAGHGKGSAFEREVAKALSLWLSKGSNPDLFWRTQASGARATQAAKSGRIIHGQGGDITSTHPDSEEFSSLFVIECKFYQDIGLVSAIVKGEGALLSFWKQVCGDAALAKKIPLLIVKQNRLPVLVGMRRIFMEEILSPLNHSPGFIILHGHGLSFTTFNHFMERTCLKDAVSAARKCLEIESSQLLSSPPISTSAQIQEMSTVGESSESLKRQRKPIARR
jgi:hypothetical protein